MRSDNVLNAIPAVGHIEVVQVGRNPDGMAPQCMPVSLLQAATLAIAGDAPDVVAAGVVYRSSIVREGDFVKTTIYVDMTGLKSSTTDLDVIGVEGADVIEDGDFAAGAGDWTYGDDWSLGTNEAECAPGAGTVMEPAVELTVVAGETYELTYTMGSFVAGACVASIGGTNFTSRGSDATFVERVIAVDSTNLKFTGNAAGNFAVDDVIVKHIPLAHLGQFTVAQNGTLFMGQVTWIETPGTGADDVIFYAADEGSAVFDDGIAALTDDTVLLNKGSAAAGAQATQIALAALPAADQYLYVTNGEGGTVGVYDAGQFVLEFWGY